MNNQVSAGQLILPIATLGGLVAAYFLGSAVAKEQYQLMMFLGGAALLSGWVVLGRSIWWLPMFFFPALGGMFYFGFKIHVHEVALLLAMVPLIFVIALNRSEIQARRHQVQGIVILLILYLAIHLLSCLIYLKVTGQPGMGNVVRRYADAMWPICFLVPFLYFGKTKFLSWAMHLMFAAVVFRFCLGIYTAYKGGSESAIFVPIINFVPAGLNSGPDLRTSGPLMTSLAIVYFCIHRNFLWRSFMLFLIALGCWGTFLGSSRLLLMSAALLVLFPLMIYKRYGLMLLGLAGFVVSVAFVNINPSSLYSLPDTARRAATAFVFDRGLATDTAGTELSDQWHFRLMEEGWKSWTENAFTIFFGRGTRAFEERAWNQGNNFEGMVEMAVATSRFEKGLWDTLCTYGIFGFALFGGCMFIVIRGGLRAIMRYRITTYPLGLAFIGTYQCVSWILLCWIGGTFPSQSIMLGLVALIALEDEQVARKERSNTAPPPPSPASNLRSPSDVKPLVSRARKFR